VETFDRLDKVVSGECNTVTAELLSRKFICEITHALSCVYLRYVEGYVEFFAAFKNFSLFSLRFMAESPAMSCRTLVR
jgi:hypothetical protein